MIVTKLLYLSIKSEESVKQVLIVVLFFNTYPCSYLHSWKVRFMYAFSWLTIASFSPLGSPPMAKQNKITCMTGRANMKSMTPTFLHIRRKFFCSSARIFPTDVQSEQLEQSSQTSFMPWDEGPTLFIWKCKLRNQKVRWEMNTKKWSFLSTEGYSCFWLKYDGGYREKLRVYLKWT